MSNVVSIVSKRLEKNNISSSSDFTSEMESAAMNKKQKSRVNNYFLKKSPNRLFTMMRSKGYTDDQILTTSFGERFGKYIVMYRFKEVLGFISIILMHLIELLIVHLTKIATITSGAFAHTSEGGEIIFYKKFEIYSCEPTLCVDPIR